MLLTSRRAFLGGLISALAAPAIVHAANIMPVRNIIILPEATFESFDKLMPEGMQYQWITRGYSMTRDAINESLYADHDPTKWRPVPASRYKERFAVAGETIMVGDCVLVERPKVHHIAARGAEIERANQQVQSWADRCMANGFEASMRFTRPTHPEWVTVSGFGEQV